MSTGGTAVSVVQEPPSSGSSTSQASGVASEGKDGAIKQAGGGEVGVPALAPPVVHNLQTHNDELLRTIAEVGKDVKPSYTNSKMSADRLKRNIALARTALRDCLLDIERLNQTLTK
ncbi:Cyclin-dependent kinase 2-associated protein 2 [Geodia barretti]|uniref:Cyclin-dependent kinase 2-associated protein 2 n=1 Tax=Geodia barretti TaxID=519541 RepID=A0AA35W5A1_GEOBA|nr:Cyclin-dependent kinase 2-associated protein 2 [Geodia barretti]